MKKLFIILILTKSNVMFTQQSTVNNYDVITFEESLKYDVKNMREYSYSPFNESTALYINENTMLIYPNLHNGRCLITSKAVCEEMFSNNSFPVLPENDTPYFKYKNLMNKDSFNKENMTSILLDLGLSYNETTFLNDAEKLSKVLSQDNKKKLLIPTLYFIGRDLQKLCLASEWKFDTKYYFQPFNEPILFYDEHFYSFYDLNILLEEKLLKGKNITFQKIYKKVEGFYLKKKAIWDLH